MTRDPRDVFVVMCNDFPDAVFETEDAARRHIEQEIGALTREKERFGAARFHQPTRRFKVYSFPVRSE